MMGNVSGERSRMQADEISPELGTAQDNRVLRCRDETERLIDKIRYLLKS